MATPKEHLAAISQLMALVQNWGDKKTHEALCWAFPILEAVAECPMDLDAMAKELDVPSCAMGITAWSLMLRQAASLLRTMPAKQISPTCAEREAMAKELGAIWVPVSCNPEESTQQNATIRKAADMLRLLPSNSTPEAQETARRHRATLRAAWANNSVAALSSAETREALEWAAFIMPLSNTDMISEETIHKMREHVNGNPSLTTEELVKHLLSVVDDPPAYEQIRSEVGARQDESTPDAIRRFIQFAKVDSANLDRSMSTQKDLREILVKHPNESLTDATRRLWSTAPMTDVVDALRAASWKEASQSHGWSTPERFIREMAQVREILVAQPEETTCQAALRVASDLMAAEADIATLDRERQNRQPAAIQEAINGLKPMIGGLALRFMDLPSKALREEVQSWHEKATGESNRTDRTPEHRERQAIRAETLESVLGLFAVTMPEPTETPNETTS